MNSEDAPADDSDARRRTPPAAEAYSVVIPADAQRLPEVRRGLVEWAERVGMTPEQVEELALASYEALSNAVAHAYSHTSAGTIEISATHQPARGRVQVTVADSGSWRPEPTERGGLGGRGMVLIRSLAEDVEVITSTAGTTVWMHWTVNASVASQLAGQ